MLLGRIAQIFTLALLVSFSVGCNPSADSDGSQAGEESATTETSESATNDDANAIVIDVRTDSEWESGHVASAVHVPHTEIADRIAEITDDKDAHIVLYCKSGGRAGTAKETLEGLGFTHVENAGGYDDVKDRFPAE